MHRLGLRRSQKRGGADRLATNAETKENSVPTALFGRLRIGPKMMIVLLLLGSAAIGVTGYTAYLSARRSMIAAVMNQLTGIRRAKAMQVEDYFRTLRNHIASLAEDRMLVLAMEAFRAETQRMDRAGAANEQKRQALRAFYRNNYIKLLSEYLATRPIEDYLPSTPSGYTLQDAYLVRNPFPWSERKRLEMSTSSNEYDRVHALYHPSLRKIVDACGYYDLMLVDHQSGLIVYTTMKEPDFGTSLKNGPYKDTALARLVNQAAQARRGSVPPLSDFEPYAPSLGAPAAFVATPILDGFQTLGVLVLQLSIQDLDRVVSGNRGWRREGLGESGDSGIVGPDYLLRSTARSFSERPEYHLETMRQRGVKPDVLARIRTFGTTILQQEVRLPSVDRALRGEEGTIRQLGSAGRASLVSFQPLNIEGLRWSIASRMDEAEALAPVERMRSDVRNLGLVVLLATAVIALLLARAIVKPVERLAAAARQATEGDLDVSVPVQTSDELGQLSASFNRMVASIREHQAVIKEKNEQNERLLLNILPGAVAERLKKGDGRIADHFAEVTVLFADLVDFTPMSQKSTPARVVDLLNELFSAFDEAAQRLGVEKIKTIGDAYMAVAGLPVPCQDHTERVIALAFEMIEQAGRLGLKLRIGVNCGPVVAGVVGTNKFIYDLWGDTVNVASRMESHGVPNAIHVTEAIFAKMRDRYDFESRGQVEVKGKGKMDTWLLWKPASVSTAGR